MALKFFLVGTALALIPMQATAYSTPQLLLVGETLVKQMSDAKGLRDCIASEYRNRLLSDSQDWIDNAGGLDRDDRIAQVLAAIQTLHGQVEATPNCPSETAKLAHTPETILRSGTFAGQEAYQSDNSLAFGPLSAREMKRSPYSTNIGSATGEFAEDAPSSVLIGSSAGRYMKEGGHAIAVGGSAAYEAALVNHSIFVGYAAGRFVRDFQQGVSIGYAAGEYAHRSHQSVAIGTFAAYEARNSSSAVMIGRMAGGYASGARESVMIGRASGKSAKNARRGVFIGVNAGSLSARTKDAVLLGTNAQAEPGVENVVGLGRNANPAQDNTVHIAGEMSLGLGTNRPSAQLHATGGVRFESVPNGVLVTDADGNVSASDALAKALGTIEELEARIEALESR